MDARFVVDNSVVMAWCFKDQANDYSDSVLERLIERRLVFPRFGRSRW